MTNTNIFFLFISVSPHLLQGPLVCLKYGAEAIAGGLELAGTVMTFIAAADEAKAARTEQLWLVAKRDIDNKALLKQYTRDSEKVKVELLAAAVKKNTAETEVELAILEEKLLNETKFFLRNMFTSDKLYGWLSRKLSQLLKISYGNALAAARMAERSLQYESNTDQTFVSSRNWSGDKNGLLAAEMLMADMSQMSLFNLRNNYRYQEIERKISLRKEIFNGETLADSLEEETLLNFDLTERMFDMDYPGHYFRTIKTVSLSIVPGSVVDFKGTCPRLTLTQVGNKVVTKPDIGAVKYLLGDDDGNTEVDPNVLRIDWRAQQVMTVSRWEEDNGMFVTDWVFDNRYFPFEGTGAVSSWSLELGTKRNGNQVDMTELLSASGSDIIMSVKYTADMDSGSFKDEVVKCVTPKT